MFKCMIYPSMQEGSVAVDLNFKGLNNIHKKYAIILYI